MLLVGVLSVNSLVRTRVLYLSAFVNLVPLIIFQHRVVEVDSLIFSNGRHVCVPRMGVDYMHVEMLPLIIQQSTNLIFFFASNFWKKHGSTETQATDYHHNHPSNGPTISS